MSTCCHPNAVRRAKIERRKRDNIVTRSKTHIQLMLLLMLLLLALSPALVRV